MITADDFRSVVRNSLQGFLTLKLSPSGFVLRECTLHEKNEKRWIGLPSKPQLDSKGRQRKDPNGKGLWVPVVEVVGKDERALFQREALAAIDRLLGKGSAP
jgi:hypothetical protein